MPTTKQTASVLPLTQKALREHFQTAGPAVFWPSDISKLLSTHSRDWAIQTTTREDVIDFLLGNSLVRIAKFTSAKYPPITRFISGSPSPYKLALALRRNSFLCHSTALTIHGLADTSHTIYVNREQDEKPDGTELTQASIRAAFKNQQRQSKFRFKEGAHEYVLISGKSTGRAGVVEVETSNGEKIDVTDLERTLIDIVVRPAYAGNIENVARVYKMAAQKIDVDYVLDLLSTIGYVYPYHQSIGFLLERAGCPEEHLKDFELLRSDFDFFLDYGLKDPSYDRKWRLFYPASFDYSSESGC